MIGRVPLSISPTPSLKDSTILTLYRFLIVSLLFTALYAEDYLQKSRQMHLSDARYWHLLLHMRGGKSEIDDPKFFLSKEGKHNAQAELEATLQALLHEQRYDDNATACRFPARKAWLVEKLHITDLPKVSCQAYQKVHKKLNPVSATIIFPSAHINSPASMFGHTFLRINSVYHSPLLSFAINYAANVDATKSGGPLYAIKGLTGGYKGYYSMLPYYDKLKEYRDSEQRDIWEYDLNLTQAEVERMFQHIWELNGIYSDYFFFTENCSYNILWLLEIARPTVHLKEHFTYQVSPLETIHAMREEGLIVDEKFRASKRRVILTYEQRVEKQYHPLVMALLSQKGKKPLERLLHDRTITFTQKRYIVEAAIELLEYHYIQAELSKRDYLRVFHTLTVARASLGRGEGLVVPKPTSPLQAHRQARVRVGVQSRSGTKSLLLGVRPVYHDIEDNSRGLLRGTQIAFLDTLLKIEQKRVKMEEFTLLSIDSFSQISDFLHTFSWRMQTGWDREGIDDRLRFHLSFGAGASWGNAYGYLYLMSDILSYATDDAKIGADLSLGGVIDRSGAFQTNMEITHRWYGSGLKQLLLRATQSYAPTSNTQIQLQYTRKVLEDRHTTDENHYRLLFNYYF